MLVVGGASAARLALSSSKAFGEPAKPDYDYDNEHDEEKAQTKDFRDRNRDRGRNRVSVGLPGSSTAHPAPPLTGGAGLSNRC
mgnify:CR=1 FL=1